MADKIAGIDVHKKVLMVVVMDACTPESKPERRRFATMPSELRRLSTWLQERGVEEAVMESTAQYWRSVWLELEAHMCLHLAQIRRPVMRRSRTCSSTRILIATSGRTAAPAVFSNETRCASSHSAWPRVRG